MYLALAHNLKNSFALFTLRIVWARWLGLSLSLLLAAISRHSNFPSNRVGNSVKEHLIFAAVNRVIATGSLSLKQIRKSSTVLILLPPITALRPSVTPTFEFITRASAEERINCISSFSSFSAQCTVPRQNQK